MINVHQIIWLKWNLQFALRIVGLARLGGETINPRCPRPIGAIKIYETRGQGVMFNFKVKTYFWENRGEIFKNDSACTPCFRNPKPLIDDSTLSNPKCLSLSRGGRTCPMTRVACAQVIFSIARLRKHKHPGRNAVVGCPQSYSFAH